MPLIQSKSKKAFNKNVEIEMDSGKPQKQSLAIAYNVKRKPKKMAEGGKVNESASSEHRPMPDERDKDSHQVSRNDSKKPLQDSSWTDQPTVRQAQKPSITPLSRPKMAQGIFKVRDRNDVDKEEMMMQEMPPASPDDQPDSEYNEMGADRKGPSVPDESKPHNKDQRKAYAEGGSVSGNRDLDAASRSSLASRVSDEYGSGPEEDHVMHPEGLESDDDSMRPSEDEIMSSHFADGGEVEEEHHASIAAAIMAKDREMYADGGQVDIEMNAEEEPNQYYHQNEDAALKENYDSDMKDMCQPMDSNEHADERESSEENEHDMVSRIRSRMMKQRRSGLP